MDEKFVRGLVVGVIATAALAYFGPAIGASVRPLVRRGVKAAVKGYVQGQETMSELQETIEDAIAEAWAELKSEAEAAATSNVAGGGVVVATAPMAEHKEIDGGSKRKRRRPTA